MASGLSVARVVDVDVVFSPVAVAQVRFDTLLIMGDSDVIDTGEAVREYNTLEDVANDFGTTVPEYLAADLYFSQQPQPDTLFIGRWARTPTSGVLVGGALTAAQQLLSAWTSITTGAFNITINGGAVTNVTGLNFSSQTNLNGVAALIDAALANATVTWNGSQFTVKSTTTGTTSSVSFASAPGTGTDISAQLKLTSATATRATTGIAAETAVAGLSRVDGRGWYGATFAASTQPNNAALLACAAYIEGTSDKHLFGITSSDANILDPNDSSDIASQLALADYMRTCIQYSIQNPYAICSFLGRAFTVDWEGSNTALTMKFKKEPLVPPEVLTGTQASTLATKRCNVYALYRNGASITQEGVMSGPAFFDEIHGTDWLANRIQTDIFNLLYTVPKAPQTNSGIHQILTRCEQGLSQSVTNGLVAPGTWNAAGFGLLYNGMLLAKGWYSFAGTVESQSQADRESRDSPPIQLAIKLAGAVHDAHCIINVNR